MKYGLTVWTGFVLLSVRSSGGFFEHGNEPSGSIKGADFAQLNDYQLLKKGTALWM
jgi:hypothetical protein